MWGWTGRRSRAVSLCVASGKGGTGKSVVSAALARCFAERGRTLLIDADMGVGNAHVLQDVSPRRSFVDVVHGLVPLSAAVTGCRENLDVIGAGSGVSHMTALNESDLRRIALGLQELEREYRYVIVDSAAGIAEQTLAFAAACDRVLLVTTPDPTAMTDAYAFLKVLMPREPRAVPWLVVNRVDPEDPDEGERVAERLTSVSEKFLRQTPECFGALPDDRAVARAVRARSCVFDDAPSAPGARALVALADRLVGELADVAPEGLGVRLARRQERAEGHRA